MKKVIGLMLALVVALTGFAFAETLTLTTNETADGYMLVSFLVLDEESYALIGAGDGSDAFEAFGSAEKTYAECYADFWAAMSLLEPVKTAVGYASEMKFAPSSDGKNTVVTVGGETIATLSGTEAFAILSENAGDSVTVDTACDVHVWTGANAVGGRCLNCGQIDDGGKEHDEAISVFCEEGHTKCMGDPMHKCDGCGREYPCSKSNSHTECAKCGELWCYKDEGDHKELACGHRGCEAFGQEAQHAKCAACSGYLCDGKNHELAACGVHHADAEGDHGKAECGHYACQMIGTEFEHVHCEVCGGWICDGSDHGHIEEPEVDA